MKEYTFETEKQANIVSEPAVAYQRRRYSYADYLGWTDDVRRELIDGIVYELSAPLRKHADITANFFSLVSWFIEKRKGKCRIYHAPFDVRLSLTGETDDDKIYTVVQPDICVICDPSKLDERGCLGAPDLIVEVLSPSTNKRDRNEKFHLYEAAGVREYWIVNPENKTLNVFILQKNGKYNESAVYVKTGKAPVHIFGGLNIDLERLFAEPAMAYQRRYTYADYLGWPDDVRRELIDGIVYELSAPLRRHARITAKLVSWVNVFIEKRKGKCEIYHAPFDVRLSLTGETDDDKIYTVVQPDICVICDPSKLDERGCLGAPDLIVEVLSPGTAERDLNEKFRLYEATGVREYWIINPENKTLNVFILQKNGKYNESAVYVKTGKAPVHIFKGLNIDLEKLFAE